MSLNDTAEQPEQDGSMFTEEEIGLLKALALRSKQVDTQESLSLSPKDDNNNGDDDEEKITSNEKTAAATNKEEDEELVPVTLNLDTFSFLIVAPVMSVPFATAIFIFLIKALIFALILAEMVNTLDPENPLEIPTSVSGPVVVAQFLALLITVTTQDDVISSLLLFNHSPHFENIRAVHPNATRIKWFMTGIFMFLSGALGLIVVFSLIMTSPDVVGLILDFTAVEFVGVLDNVGFGLAQQGLLGKPNRAAAQDIEETEYHLPKRTVVTPVKQMICMFAMYLALIAGWAVIYTNQIAGLYTPGTLVVQFDDEIVLDIGTYSGVYELKNKPFAVGFDRIRYEAADSTLGVFAYCREQEVWTFVLEKDSRNPCEDVLVRSSPTVSFDILESAGDQWFVSENVEAARFFPMENFQMSLGCEEDSDCGGEGNGGCNDDSRCECSPGFYGLNCDFERATTCPVLELNQEALLEETGRQFSRQYFTVMQQDEDAEGSNEAAMPLEVYNHQVFVSNFVENSETHLILFTGLRWILTALPDKLNITDLTLLREFLNLDPEIVAQTLLKGESYLVSEPLRANTPADVDEPFGLEWLPATIVGNESMLAPSVSVDLFCAKCDNETNLCGFENTCPADRTCICDNGATGTRCLNPPTGDGRCHNEFFNIGRFNFDGGDCCEVTCVNQGSNICGVTGFQDVGNLFIGYPFCAARDGLCEEGDSCYLAKSNSIPSLSSFAETLVTLTGNGRIIAIAEPSLDTVQIMRQTDSNWAQVGSSLQGRRGSFFGQHVAFSSLPVEIVGRTNGNLPLVVAIAFGREGLGGIRVMSMLDDAVDWTQIGNDIELCTGQSDDCEIKSIDVGANGNIITVAGTTNVNGGTVSVYSATTELGRWSRMMTVAGSKVSLSTLGDILAVGDDTGTKQSSSSSSSESQTQIVRYNVVDNSILSIHDLSNFGNNTSIEGMKMDGDGEEITVYLTNTTNQIFSLIRFGIGATLPKPHDGTMLLDFGNNDGDDNEDNVLLLDPPIVDFSDDGAVVTVRGTSNVVKVLKFNSSSLVWKEIGNDIPISSRTEEFAVSHDGETVAVGGDSPTDLFRLNERCNGTSFQFSYTMDDSPSGITWFGESFRYIGDIRIPTNTFSDSCDGCYDDNLFRTMAFQSGCLPADECFGFRFETNNTFDEGFGFVFLVNGTEKGILSSNTSNLFEIDLHDDGVGMDFVGQEMSSSSSCRVNGTICDEGEAVLTLMFDLDGHPEETSWFVRNSTEDVISFGGGYNETGRVIRQECVASDECYSLTVEDAGEDGLWRSSGYGGYRVFFDGRLEFDGNGDFGASQRIIFGGCPEREVDPVSVEVTFIFDPFLSIPSETSWVILDGARRTIAEGGPYVNQPGNVSLVEFPCEVGMPDLLETPNGIVVDGVVFDEVFSSDETFLGGTFVNATVVDANFDGSILVDSLVMEGSFINSRFSNVTVIGGVFSGCVFAGTEILNGTFSNSQFINTVVMGGTFENVAFYDSTIENGTIVESFFIHPNSAEIALSRVADSVTLINSTALIQEFEVSSIFNAEEFTVERFNVTTSGLSLNDILGVSSLADLWECTGEQKGEDPLGLCETNPATMFDLCGTLFSYDELFAFFDQDLNFVNLFGNDTVTLEREEVMLFPDESHSLIVRDPRGSGIFVQGTYTVGAQGDPIVLTQSGIYSIRVNGTKVVLEEGR